MENKNYILSNGKYSILRGVLHETQLNILRSLANKKLKTKKTPPIYICDQDILGKDSIERYRNACLKKLLKSCHPWIKNNIGEQWLILSHKFLLRRTWPLSEDTARSMGHNASNLTWHQDSNPQHKSNPMVVIMAFLQNNAGDSRPGISIIDANTETFEGVYGYEGNRVDELENKIIKDHGELRIQSPLTHAGDVILFNGLTFHRTFSNSKMTKHRDALLLRIVNPKHVANFPSGPHLKTHERFFAN